MTASRAALTTEPETSASPAASPHDPADVSAPVAAPPRARTQESTKAKPISDAVAIDDKSASKKDPKPDQSSGETPRSQSTPRQEKSSAPTVDPKPPPAQSGPSPDSKKLQAELEEQQRKFEEEDLDKAQRARIGARKQLENSTKELDKMANASLLEWAAYKVGGSDTAIKNEVQRDQDAYQDRIDRERDLRKSLERSKERAVEGQKLLDEAASLRRSGNDEAAQQVEAQGLAKFQEAHDAIKSDRGAQLAIELKQQQRLRDSQKDWKSAVSRLDAATETLETAKMVVKTGGQIVGNVIAGPGGGAAVVGVFDAAESLGTQIAEVGMGDKTFAEGAKDLGVGVIDAAVDAGITLVAGKVGGAVAGKVGGAGMGIAGKAAIGAGTGAAIGAGGAAIQGSYDYAKARIEFERAYPNLSGPEAEAAWREFAEERGVTGKAIVRRVAGSAASGAIAGAVTGGMGGKGAPKLSSAGQAATHGAADVAGGALDNAIQGGDLSPTGLIIAGLAGAAGVHGGRRSKNRAHVEGTEHPHSKNNPHPAERTTLPENRVPSNVDDYRQERKPDPHPAHTANQSHEATGPEPSKSETSRPTTEKPTASGTKDTPVTETGSTPHQPETPTSKPEVGSGQPAAANIDTLQAPTPLGPDREARVVKLRDKFKGVPEHEKIYPKEIKPGDPRYDRIHAPEGYDMQGKTVLDPDTIRYSQRYVEEGATEKIKSSMQTDGWQCVGPDGRDTAIDVVRMPDGQLTSIDNRRLLAARESGSPVVVRIHEYNEPITDPVRQRDLRVSDLHGNPGSWGQAVENRCWKQGSKFRNESLWGTHEKPALRESSSGAATNSEREK